MLPLNGLTAFITGAGQGIGRAIAEALALGGAALYLADINGGAVQEVAASLSSGGAHAQSLALDVANRDACFNAASTLTQDGKKIDILVNAAGIYKAAPFLAHTNADFQRLLDINLFGVINLSQAFLPGMQERGFGRIVNIASTAGKSGQPNQSAYNISKHAVIGLTRCLAVEYVKSGITVNAVCPGPVQSSMLDGLRQAQAQAHDISPEAFTASMLARVPLGRFLEPAEIAGLVAYLVQPNASGITGQSLNVDGGMHPL